jgi:coenzyme F420-reducing hydrogenase delta subunit
MCSGRVDLAFVLRAFSKGADGVFIGGCHLNDCHYNPEGNYDALGMRYMCVKLLEYIGINAERLRLEWVSAGEGIRFAEIMNDFGQKVKNLGPLGSCEGMDIKNINFKIKAVTKLIPYIKMVERERLRVPVRTEEAYHKFFTGDDFNRLFNELILDKLILSQIMLLLREKPQSTEEISRILNLAPSEVSRHLNSSSQQGLVMYDTNCKCYAISQDE